MLYGCRPRQILGISRPVEPSRSELEELARHAGSCSILQNAAKLCKSTCASTPAATILRPRLYVSGMQISRGTWHDISDAMIWEVLLYGILAFGKANIQQLKFSITARGCAIYHIPYTIAICHCTPPPRACQVTERRGHGPGIRWAIYQARMR